MVVYIDYKIKKIQELRAIHTISDAGIDVLIPKKESYKFSYLKEKFDMIYIESEEQKGIKLSSVLSINHEAPITGLGSLEKPLIFPVPILEYCKTIWNSDRKHQFTFAGLITKSRNVLISTWINTNITNEKFTLPITDSFSNKWRSKIFNFFNIDSTVSKTIGSLIIWSSNKGRKFPVKAWDDDYFKVLADSKFVLCPSGVCIWSYRFFESILCGAIPIVEKNCEAYKGFKFKYMDEDASKFVWSKEDAEYNYNLCLERISIHKDMIRAEIEKIKQTI